MLNVLNQLVTIVKAVGIAPSEHFLSSAQTALTAAGSTLTSSMYRDLQKGASVEVERILTDLLRRGEEAGIATHLFAAASTTPQLSRRHESAVRARTWTHRKCRSCRLRNSLVRPLASAAAAAL